MPDTVHSPILFEDAAVRLVNDNQVEMPRREQLLPIICSLIVDSVHDGGVSRKYGSVSRLVLASLQQIAGRKIRHMFDEFFLCLPHQFHAVGEEQDVRYPAVILQNIHERNSRAGLSGSR